MGMLLILGAIALVIFYVLRMRANQKADDDESNEKGQQGFMKDMFFPSGNVSNTDSDNSSSSATEEDDEDDYEEAPQTGDPYNDLEKLAALHDKGILTKEEYDAKKKELLDRI